MGGQEAEMNLSIVVPAYNEEDSIGGILDKIKEVLDNKKIKYELIVVDDGSTDKTLEIIKGKKDIKVVHHINNRGYGATLKSGIEYTTNDLIAIIDSDGTYPVSDIPKLWELIKTDESEFDMVVGARIGEEVHIPFFRRPAKWFLKWLANYLTGCRISDLNSGLRIFKKGLFERFVGILPDGFSFTTTITIAALANGFQVKFVPINYYYRQGTSSIKPLRDFINFLILIIRLVVYFKPLNIFLPASMFLFSIGLVKAFIDFYKNNFFGVGSAIVILTAIQIAFLGLLADLILKRTKL